MNCCSNGNYKRHQGGTSSEENYQQVSHLHLHEERANDRPTDEFYSVLIAVTSWNGLLREQTSSTVPTTSTRNAGGGYYYPK